MKIAIGTYYVDALPVKMVIDENNRIKAVVDGQKFFDAESLLDAFPLLDTRTNADAVARILTPLYLGLNFFIPESLSIYPHFTENELIWSLQEDRTRLFYKANLTLKSRSLCVTLI